MRDRIANASFWKQALAFQEEDIVFFEESYRKQDPAKAGGRGNSGEALRDSLFEMSLLLYSAGAPMEEVVAPGFRAVAQHFPEIVSRFGTKMPNGIARVGYDNYLRDMSFLVLARAESTEAEAFFRTLDQFDLQMDGYGGYDRIWAAYRQHFGLPEVPVTSDVHWPEAYQNLWLAIDPAEPEFARPHHLKKFVDGWYDEMASELAAQTTRGENLGENSTYVGYWCLEAAAASVAFGIDDRELRDHPHYPAEWADWARS
ncbi:DUF1911 domain-containing protein [Epibacterium sp. MM17-32]|uniref:PoNe immunity protein domain-containing protein n=1 Tax=Epibacterium sp. MM17-32 TaxID=2917734 RepID=UPI001EF55EF1|nr:PoNe immunity protein domain-containing protein [Epibacterium sp. MM17-32]MCG7626734.1 DUF1911 domain-containing protein [Epibacterium sp. MM17-32]